MPEPNPPTRRRWFRFGLRSLLVFTAIFGVLMGWIANGIIKDRYRRSIVDNVKRLGCGAGFYWRRDIGTVHVGDHLLINFDEESMPSLKSLSQTLAKTPGAFKVWIIIGGYGDGPKTPIAWRELSRLSHIANLQCIECHDTQIADLTPLAALPGLEVLIIGGTQVRDLTPLSTLTNLRILFAGDLSIKDLRPLRTLTNLETLGLNGTQVSDLTPLANLTDLRTLWLDNTQVVDLAPIANLVQLEGLGISGTKVTDVTHLTGLKRLKWIRADKTQFSKLQINALQNALPNCKIDTDTTP